MIIITQQENYITNDLNITWGKHSDSEYRFINEKAGCIGKYDSEKKAAHVFQEIINNYNNGARVYKMPQNEDVQQ